MDIDACDPSLVAPGEQPPCNNNPCTDLEYDRQCSCDMYAGFVGKYCQGALCQSYLPFSQLGITVKLKTPKIVFLLLY